ncbi:sulfatase/phosphatase domain-containing protein [Algoriphagus boritolerans]
MVEAMDQAIGKVLDEIEAQGLSEKTLIVFFSDHGGLSTAEGSPTSNLPLRAGKGWLYEGGIRVPMIVNWAGKLNPGKKIDTPVISNDLKPTILDLVGIGGEAEDEDGKSLKNLITGSGELEDRPLYWHYPHYGNQGGNPGSVIRKGDWKLIYFYESDSLELYNLKVDIGEKHNLADQETELAGALKTELFDWLVTTKAAFPRPNN